MVDFNVVSQLVDSIEQALRKLEYAYQAKDITSVNQLRLFIFNTHKRIDNLLNGAGA